MRKKKKPCCRNPRLQPMGVSPVYVSGVAYIRWYRCLSCQASTSESVTPQQNAPVRAPEPKKPIVKPSKTPTCCVGRDMIYDGWEGSTIAGIQTGFHEWHCPCCCRKLRQPVEIDEIMDEDEDF